MELAWHVRSRPALIVFACIACGYTLAWWAAGVGSGYWLFGALVCLAIASAARGRACKAALTLAVVLLAGGWMSSRVHELPADALARRLNPDLIGERALMTLHGVVEDWPVDLVGGRGALGALARSEPSCVFNLRVLNIENDAGSLTRASGRLVVRVEASSQELPACVSPGTGVRVTGRVEPARGAMNPGEPPWAERSRQDGRAGLLRLPSVELISEAPVLGTLPGLRAGIDRALGALRMRAARALGTVEGASADTLDPPESQSTYDQPAGQRSGQHARALLGAMLLGQRSSALDPVSDAFTRQGLVHLVAISGFNLAVMGGVVLVLVRLGGDRGWVEPALLGVLVAGYMLILPADAGIMRCGLVMLSVLSVEAFGRRYDRVNTLALVGCALLVVRPMDLWSAGFQLTFAIVAGLQALGNRSADRLFGERVLGVKARAVEPGRVRWWTPARWTLWLARLGLLLRAHAGASLLAWGIATPIIAVHTGVISPLAPITGLIVLPLAAVVLWCGYIALLAGMLVPWVERVTMGALDVLGGALVNVVMWIDRHAGLTLHAPALSAALGAGAIVCVVYWIARGHVRSRLAWAMTCVLALWTIGECVIVPRLLSQSVLRTDTLSVGDGTCHLVRSGSHAMLWDCGSLATGVGQRTIPDAVRALGAGSVPTLLITHAHLDHYAGVPDVIAPLGVELVLISPQFERAASADPGSGAAVVLGELRRRGVDVRVVSAGDHATLGACTIEFLWPPADRDFKDPNDASLVAMVHAPSATPRRVLFTGDISRQATPELLPETDQQQRALRADVLELPHHGAFLESKAALVSAVNPSVVVQSTGPARARDTRWDPLKADRSWYITARDGAISTIVHPDGRIESRSER